MNVIYNIKKLHNWRYDSKLENLVQKIKVKKLDFNIYFLTNKSDIIRVLFHMNEDKNTLSFDI